MSVRTKQLELETPPDIALDDGSEFSFDGFHPVGTSIDPNVTSHGPRITSGSGIRGLYGNRGDLSASDAFNVTLDGYLYGSAQIAGAIQRSPDYRKLRIVVGRDPRPTGCAVRKALFRGFDVAMDEYRCRFPDQELELTVIDVGINMTPIIQNAVRLFDTVGGVVITASHNPVEWNGYKFLTANFEPGNPYSQRGALLNFARMAEFKRRRAEFLDNLRGGDANVAMVAEKFISRESKNRTQDPGDDARILSIEAYQRYLRKMMGLEDDPKFESFVERARKSDFSIIVDHNGGAAQGITANLLRDFGFQAIEIGDEIGTPSHAIEPMDDALKPAGDRLEQVGGSAFAVVHDWDADRGTLVILSDGKACDLSPQYTCALNVYAMIEQHASQLKPNRKTRQRLSVVVNGNTSGSIRVIANQFTRTKNVDVEIVEVETGEINLVEKMEELRRSGASIPIIGVEGSCGGVIFGGETTGATSRDGAMTALVAANLVLSAGHSLDKIVKQLPVFHTCFKSLPHIEATPVAIKTALEAEFRRRIVRHKNGTFQLQGISDKRYKAFKVIHYIGTGVYDTMDKDTNGGYKIRLEDVNGNESFFWYRDSKTEPEIYIESDSTDMNESRKLFEFIQHIVLHVNADTATQNGSRKAS